MYRATEGPNGWYVSEDDADGFHRQPEDGGTLTRRQAESNAKLLNEQTNDPEADCEYDPDRS